MSDRRGSGKQVEKMVHLEQLLSAAQIHFIRKDYRDDAVEVFRGEGVTGDEKTIEELFARWAE